MGEDYYYDYSHYYDTFKFNVTSTTPGMNVLLITTAYTVLCIIIGFLFKCRKRKWRNKKEDTAAKPRNGEKNDQNTPEAWMDTNPYMCAVDEVVENSFFDYDIDKSSDARSVDSDDSSKAYEYWENMFGPEGTDEAETSYELYEEDTGNADKNLEVRPSKEIMEIPPEPTIASITTDSQTTKIPQSVNVHDSLENFTDDPPIKSEKPVAKRKEKRVEVRRFLFGRRKRRFSVKKMETKSMGQNFVKEVDEKKTRSRRFNRLFHKPNGLEIELKAGRWGSSKDVDESYEYFDDYEDPIEVDKQFDPDLNHSRHTSCSKDASKSEEIVDRSGEGDDTYEKEMKEIYKLAVPWTISSFISYLSSIVAIALISSYMSVAAMICYSYVWFIIEAAFIYSSALYNSLYKHVNNAVATETEEGYNKAGKYIRVCILINLIISVPISIGVVYGMGPIMKFYGFGDAMVQMCHGYTIIAVVHNFASTTSGFVTITTDIDGYADFNAKYAFFDSLVDIALSAIVIPLCRPSLVQLGLIHFAHDIISTAFYYYLTHYRWGWYDVYRTGMGSALTYDRKEKKAISTLIKKSIPMTLDELNGELEWLVSAYFASFLGSAESASWILLSYIWGLIGVVPSCVGSAAEYRVAYQLSKGNIEVAKQMSNRSMVITGITSLVGTAIMFAARHPLISVITSDYDLSKMLIGVMPYLFLCQPLISLTTTGAYLNRALAMYQRSTKIELLITCLITLPAAWVSTFIYGWDISGLTAASFVGYATTGAVILAIYNNADWDKAVRKNRKMAGTVESSKLDTSIDTHDTQSRDDTMNSSFNIETSVLV